MLLSPTRSPSVPEGPVSQMQLVFEDDEEEEEEKSREEGEVPADSRARSSGAPKAPAGNTAAPAEHAWDSGGAFHI